MKNAIVVACVAVAVGAGAGGCSWFRKDPKPKPMPAEAFFAPGRQTDPGAGEGRRPVATAPVAELTEQQRRQEADRQAAIARRNGSTRAAAGAATRSASAPASRPVTLGEYMTLGGVIVEVNGTPIYANRLVREITPALEANARDMDREQYRIAAMQLIQNQTRLLVRNELEFAAAQRNLEERDKQMVDALTSRWRQDQITQAGGSLELARQRSGEIARRNNMPEDLTFEQLVQEKHREYMIRIWIERKIKPRVQITQADMRDYYRKHAEEEWITQHSQARFRVIRIDPAATGGREAALEKVKGIKQRADAGEDFEKMASQTNDNRALLQKGGDVGWIQKGAYALEKVEEAVWQTQPGHVTPIVEDRGGFYVAEVTAKKEGRVRPFEEQEVQDAIEQRIRGEQVTKLRDRHAEQLEKDATIRSDRNMVSTALEMAMQAYPRWSGGRAAAE